jgi:DNA-binding SARP family transcriptional activator
VCLLGGFRLFKDGARLPLRPGGRAETFLATLAFHGKPGIHRDSLIELVWPEAEPVLGAQSLNTLVYSLRRMLGDAVHHGSPVVHGNGRYRLNVEGGVSIDIAEFDDEIDHGDRLMRAGNVDAAMQSYESAIALYEGDLEVGPEVGQVLERERLRARYLSLWAHLGDHHYRIGAYDEALSNALALLRNDPCREDAHRMVMRCYVRLGQRAQALRQYGTCVAGLDMEFGARPEKATTVLYEMVRLNPDDV